MLKTSLSIDLSSSATQVLIEFNEIDIVGGDGGGNLVKKLLKVKKPQRARKSYQFGEIKFLTYNTRLAFTKLGFNYIKLTIKNN